jgi:hypothetical protein
MPRSRRPVLALCAAVFVSVSALHASMIAPPPHSGGTLAEESPVIGTAAEGKPAVHWADVKSDATMPIRGITEDTADWGHGRGMALRPLPGIMEEDMAGPAFEWTLPAQAAYGGADAGAAGVRAIEIGGIAQGLQSAMLVIAY